jgi:hypothetical protein
MSMAMAQTLLVHVLNDGHEQALVHHHNLITSFFSMWL